MKRATKLGLSLVSALGAVWLAGCGAMPTTSGLSRVSVVDEQRMISVEKAADTTGARIYWVNPPTRRVQ